jgi:ribosomal protein L20
MMARKRRNKTLKMAKGYWGSKSKHFKMANQAVMKSLTYAYVSRRLKKRDFRQLWITRISAACKLNGMNYSTFMHGLKVAGIEINRKMLSEMAISNPAAFTQLVEIAKKFDLKIISIAQMIAYRLREESLIERGVTVPLPTEWGEFNITPFRQKSNGVEHVALTKGEWTEEEPVLIRVHSSCATGDIFGSYRCDCGDQLHQAMQLIEKEGKGAIVYLNQEGRGIGLCNKIHAYQLQDEGLDTVDANLKLGFKADERDYGVGASIIRELGIRKMRLMTNNPSKRAGLEGYGLTIDEIVPIVIEPNLHNMRYLSTKQERMHHTLGIETDHKE